jgi:Trypsin-like peptidase domain
VYTLDVHYLGTGSIVGDGSVLLTADHVIRDWANAGPLAIAIPTHPERIFEIEPIERDWRHDLALLRINAYRPDNANPLAVRFDIPIYSTQLVASVDYGLTEFENDKLRLSVACRVGNVTRVCDMTELFGLAGKTLWSFHFQLCAVRVERQSSTNTPTP